MRPVYMESIGPMDPIEAEMQLREWARENVIEQMLLTAAAAVDSEPVPSGQEDEATFRLSRLIARIHAGVPLPTQKEISTAYKQNREHFVTPELLHVAHIVKNVDEQHDEASARSAIEEALKELEAGRPFAEVADRYSDCPGSGGDLGWFPRGQMVEEFDDVVFRLAVGARSGIFRTQFGFHIATVLGRKSAGPRALPEVQDHIVASIMSDRRQKALEEYIDQLRANAVIRQGRSA